MKRVMLLLGMMITVQAQAAEETPIPVPHDRYAEHFLVHKSGKSTQRVVITRRKGLTGELYTKRSYNCDKQTVRMLSTGYTLESLEKQQTNWPENKVSDRSVVEDIGIQACSES